MPVLEQPVTSAMPKCEPLKSVLQCIGAQKHTTWLGAFGGESPKPLQLWCARGLSALQRPKPSGLESLCDTNEQTGSYSGRRKALKISQTYT